VDNDVEEEKEEGGLLSPEDEFVWMDFRQTIILLLLLLLLLLSAVSLCRWWR
jgi:hypothetical protein